MSLPRFAFPPVLAFALTLGAVGFAPTDAFAQDADDVSVAEALFQEGRRLFKSGDYTEACPKFEESQRLVPKLGTLLNLATCHDKQGKTGSAWGEYTKAVTMAKQAGEQERVDYARAQLKELEPRLSKVLIEVPSPVEGIEVLLDGKPIGEAVWRTPLPVDPGTHEVVARASGYKSWSAPVTVEAKPTTTLVAVPALEPGEDAKAPTPAPDGTDSDAPDEGGMSGLAIAGWVVGGIGVVGLGVGSYFGVNTFMKQGDSDAFCDGTLCDQEGVDLRDEARTSATISTVLFGVGLAAVAGGATMLIIDALGDEDGDAETAGLTVNPVVGPGAYGAMMGVQF